METDQEKAVECEECKCSSKITKKRLKIEPFFLLIIFINSCFFLVFFDNILLLLYQILISKLLFLSWVLFCHVEFISKSNIIYDKNLKQIQIYILYSLLQNIFQFIAKHSTIFDHVCNTFWTFIFPILLSICNFF